jgi:hypothetical protein
VSVSLRAGRCPLDWKSICPHLTLGSNSRAVRQKDTSGLCPTVLLLPRAEVLPPRGPGRLCLRHPDQAECPRPLAPCPEPAAGGPDCDRRVPARRTQVRGLPAHVGGLPGAGLPGFDSIPLASGAARPGPPPGQRVWAYRKAAWAIEDLEPDMGLVYRHMGRRRLESIEHVGPRLAEVVEDLLNGLSAESKDCERPGFLDCGVLPGVESSV